MNFLNDYKDGEVYMIHPEDMEDPLVYYAEHEDELAKFFDEELWAMYYG